MDDSLADEDAPKATLVNSQSKDFRQHNGGGGYLIVQILLI